ncbi:hypothetical protein KJ865_02360 [Myxococcota bacterium]|nr:hypothetical protein [Myxococcota bacterium]
MEAPLGDPYFAETIDQPLVRILAPSEEDLVTNPVIITVSTYNIHRYELYENKVLIRRETAPLEHSDIQWTMLDTGLPHTVELFGFNTAGEEVAYDRVRVIPLPEMDLSKGDLVGNLWISYYYLSREVDFGVREEIVLRDSQCVPLAVVDYAYMAEVCVEGSGQLLDHGIINFAKRCNCSVPCPYGGGKICYTELSREKFPWGSGAGSKALIPFRSLAVDNNVIPHNELIYMEEWDGVYIPPRDGIGNFIHDGCFIAHDVGGWIKNDHFDFFTGTHGMWLDLERIAPTRSRFTLYTNPGRCKWLRDYISHKQGTSGTRPDTIH